MFNFNVTKLDRKRKRYRTVDKKVILSSNTVFTVRPIRSLFHTNQFKIINKVIHLFITVIMIIIIN